MGFDGQSPSSSFFRPRRMKQVIIQVRRIILSAAILSTAVMPGNATGVKDALDWLDGHWEGPRSAILIDSQRHQANVDRNKPFQWEAFNVRDVSRCMVVFDIGQRRLIAMLYANREMHVTGLAKSREDILYADAAGRKALPCPKAPGLSLPEDGSDGQRWGGPR